MRKLRIVALLVLSIVASLSLLIPNALAQTADAGPDQTVYVDEIVSFNGAVSDFPTPPDLPQPSWFYWDFGDGSPLAFSSPAALHTYSSAGVYTATFIVECVYDVGGPPPEPGPSYFNISDTCTITVLPLISVGVDIKPGSWPNPLQLHEKGVLPVAICGTEDLDITTIDPETVRLTLEGLGVGVPPLRWTYEDVATPYMGEPWSGHDLGPDGYLDLTLKFKTQEVIQTLGLDAFGDGDVVILLLTGNIKAEFDGTAVYGQDYVWVLHK